MLREKHLSHLIKTMLLAALLLLFSGCGSDDTPAATRNPATSGLSFQKPAPAPAAPEYRLPSAGEVARDGRPDKANIRLKPGQRAYEGPDVEEKPAVDGDFFLDAAFIGNSLVDGLRIFSGLSTDCDVYAQTSLTVIGAPTYLEESGIADKKYEKVYVMFGINEITNTPESFKSYFSDVIDILEDMQPSADIYIMGLTPVSYKKATTDTRYSMDKIYSFNEKLYELAGEQKCYYLDLCSALAGEDGYLAPELTYDGIHFSAGHYKTWLDFLKTHYV